MIFYIYAISVGKQNQILLRCKIASFLLEVCT